MTHFTALERLLQTERFRQRAARLGGFAIPAMNVVPLTADAAPLLATNMKGTFLPTRLSREGTARYGFSHVPVGTDDTLLRELHRILAGQSNRCKTITEALQRLQGNGFEPKTLVVGEGLLSEVVPRLTPTEAWAAMQAKSEVGSVDGLTILLADLPGKAALVATLPNLVGYYTRTGDYLGVLIRQFHQTVMVVT